MSKHFFQTRLPLLGFCAALLSFTACSDDEEGTGVAPSLPALGQNRPITDIRSGGGYYGGSRALYIYDLEGHMTGGYDFGKDFVISTDPFLFEISSSSYPATWKNITTNSRGGITSATIEEYDTYEDMTYTYELRASYTGDGRLSRLSGSVREDGVTCTYQWTLQYEDGNLVSMVEEDAEPGYKAVTTWDFEYDEAGRRPNSGICFLMDDDILPTEPFQWYAGYWGRLSDEIPLSCEYTYVETEDGEDVYDMTSTTRYDVTYNSDGTVASFGFNGGVHGSEHLTFTYGNDFSTGAGRAVPAVRPAAAGEQPQLRKSLRERIRARRAAAQR